MNVAVSQKLLYVITQAPYSSANGHEALEAILIACAFEQEVNVLFIHDGVFQLKSEQSTEQSLLKQTTKTFRALSDFGVEAAYVFDSSLFSRALTVDELMIEPTVVDNQAVTQMMAESFRVFTF